MNGQEWPKHYDYLISDTVQPLRPSLHLVKPMENDDMNPLLNRLLSLEKEMTQELRDKSRIPDEQKNKPKNEKLDQIMEEEPENGKSENEKSDNHNLNSNSRTSMSKSNEHNLESDENYSEDDEEDAESDDYDSEEEERLRQEEEMEMERLIEARRLEVEAQRRKIEDARKAEQEAKIRKEEAEAFDKMFDTVIKQEVTHALEQNWQTSTRNDTVRWKIQQLVEADFDVSKIFENHFSKLLSTCTSCS